MATMMTLIGPADIFSGFVLFLVPIFVQVGLTFGLLFWLGPARVGALRRGEVRLQDVALGQKAWPDRITQISNAYASQFELPVLFYVLMLLALTVPRAGDPIVSLGAWIFVLSRVAHAYVYVTSNDVPMRFRAFVVGAFTLAAMWLWVFLRLALGIL